MNLLPARAPIRYADQNLLAIWVAPAVFAAPFAYLALMRNGFDTLLIPVLCIPPLAGIAGGINFFRNQKQLERQRGEIPRKGRTAALAVFLMIVGTIASTFTLFGVMMIGMIILSWFNPELIFSIRG